jgi:uncharacterized membrane protein
MFFLMGDYYFSTLEVSSKSEIEQIMAHCPKGCLRLDEESYCEEYIVVRVYQHCDKIPFGIVVPVEMAVVPSIMLITPDLMAIGFGMTVAMFSFSKKNLTFKRELSGPFVYMKLANSKLLVISETGIFILAENGDTIDSLETDMIISFDLTSNGKVVCHTDSGIETISF